MKNIAIVGSGDNILAFKSGGCDTFLAYDNEEAKSIIRKLAQEYKVIFIAEKLASELDDFLKRFSLSVYPVILPLPESNDGYGMKKLRQQTENALGIDILFHREDN